MCISATKRTTRFLSAWEIIAGVTIIHKYKHAVYDYNRKKNKPKLILMVIDFDRRLLRSITLWGSTFQYLYIFPHRSTLASTSKFIVLLWKLRLAGPIEAYSETSTLTIYSEVPPKKTLNLEIAKRYIYKTILAYLKSRSTSIKVYFDRIRFLSDSTSIKLDLYYPCRYGPFFNRTPFAELGVFQYRISDFSI